MEFEDVLTFLSVVENQSITKAADTLYLGQGTVSSRLKRLEKELGYKLIERGAGIRNIQLTPEGVAFLDIAKEWKEMDLRARKIKDMKLYMELRIGATNSLNTYLLDEVYSSFIGRHPDISLYLQTEHSNEIHQRVERQELDIGFVTNLHKYPDLSSRKLFTEGLVIVCSEDYAYADDDDIDLLKPEDEIYMIYSSEYEIWHQHVFQTDRHKVTVGTLSMVERFILSPDSWTVVPLTAADWLIHNHPSLVKKQFKKNPPPNRNGFLVTLKNQKPWVKDMTQLFLHELNDIHKLTNQINLLD